MNDLQVPEFLWKWEIFGRRAIAGHSITQTGNIWALAIAPGQNDLYHAFKAYVEVGTAFICLGAVDSFGYSHTIESFQFLIHR
jgi:hypothetical protein